MELISQKVFPYRHDSFYQLWKGIDVGDGGNHPSNRGNGDGYIKKFFDVYTDKEILIKFYFGGDYEGDGIGGYRDNRNV